MKTAARALTVVAGVAAIFSGVLDSGRARGVWVGVGVAALLGLAVIGIIRDRRLDRAKAGLDNATDAVVVEAASVRLLMFDTLAGVARATNRMATTPPEQRAPQAVSALSAGLAAALGLVSGDRKRATIFMRVQDPDGVDVFVPSELTSGRGDLPFSRFRRDEPEGAAVWLAAEADEPRFFPDLDTSPPPGYVPSPGRVYKAFITVPIMSKAEPVGLFTINTPQPYGLDEVDVGTMQTIAAMLGAVLGLVDGVWPVRPQ